MMKYYPIGTVVSLVNGNRPLMIYGRKQIQNESDILWDYVACFYPEGNMGDDYNVFFQHEEINKVLHNGYESQADEIMQQALNATQNM